MFIELTDNSGTPICVQVSVIASIGRYNSEGATFKSKCQTVLNLTPRMDIYVRETYEEVKAKLGVVTPDPDLTWEEAKAKQKARQQKCRHAWDTTKGACSKCGLKNYERPLQEKPDA